MRKLGRHSLILVLNILTVFFLNFKLFSITSGSFSDPWRASRSFLRYFEKSWRFILERSNSFQRFKRALRSQDFGNGTFWQDNFWNFLKTMTKFSRFLLTLALLLSPCNPWPPTLLTHAFLVTTKTSWNFIIVFCEIFHQTKQKNI